MTDLLLQLTGNPTQYEVIADGQIVGHIALFSALQDQSAASGPVLGLHRGRWRRQLRIAIA